jgi:membrane protease YdiL (CAAX protease family)
MRSTTHNNSTTCLLNPLDNAYPAKLALPGAVTEPVTGAAETGATSAAPAAVRPVPSWWEALLWMLAMFITYDILPAVVFAVWALLRGVQLEDLADTADAYALPLVLGGQLLTVVMTVCALRLRVGRNWTGALQLRPPALLPCLLAVLCLPAVTCLGIGIEMLVTHVTGLEEPTGKLIAESIPQWGLWFCLLVVAVGAAVNEELFCRGFLGRGLVGRYGVLTGVLLASAIFGAIHVNLPQGLCAFAVGCFLQLAYRATRSLWVPVLLHFLNNAAALLLFWAFPNLEPTGWQLLWFAVPAYAVAIPAAWALYRLRDRQIAAAPLS